jgi:hypothetical protein
METYLEVLEVSEALIRALKDGDYRAALQHSQQGNVQ